MVNLFPTSRIRNHIEIIAAWPYYASKSYQEMAGMERFNGKGLRLVILNPSLLLGPGDERLQLHQSDYVIFSSRKIQRGAYRRRQLR